MPACINHPDVETAMSCAVCQRPLCRNCLVDFQGGTYCGYCRDAELRRMQLHGAPRPVSAPPRSDVSKRLIPKDNPRALAGYYLGIFSFIPFLGNLLGPAAVVAGIMGLRARKRDPKISGTAHAVIAIVLGSLTTIGYWWLTIFLLKQSGAF